MYCLALPFQLWSTLKWLTVPGTAVVTFFFFGFLSIGEEIENPFGYDKNDLNLDHFTNTIIASELAAITETPAPDVQRWAFSPDNDQVFSLFSTSTHFGTKDATERLTPAEWLHRGLGPMQEALMGTSS